ncbi:MAG: NHLP bacteriocin system secretion protein [Planctomycetia bacterium]|nr:NHLP bacteriocin system secretion protein [Planctomycetia bacterium]
MAREIFRKEALDQLASPEGLDRPWSLVPARAWVSLAALSALVGGALVWSILGRIPETVAGAGVLINPGRVRSLQSPYGGQIVELSTRVGQHVNKGDMLAVVNQSELRQALQQAKVRMKELERVDQSQRRLEADRSEKESSLRMTQQESLNQGLLELESIGSRMIERNQELLAAQLAGLKKTREEVSGLHQELAGQLARFRALETKRLATSDAVIAAGAEVVRSDIQLAEMDLKTFEFALKDLEIQQLDAQRRTRQVELKSELRRVALEAVRAELDRSQSEALRESQIMDQRDRIATIEKQLDEQGMIRSPVSGRVVELAVNLGQVIGPGSRCGAVEADDEDAELGLRNLVYLPLSSGKRLNPGLKVRVTPTTVQRERYGGILGKVTRVSPYPVTEESATAIVGNPEIVKALAQPGGMIEVEVELERDANSFSGFRWTSAGPKLKFSAGTTTATRITVEERAPITFVLPILNRF